VDLGGIGESALIGPGLKIGQGIKHAAPELAKPWTAADYALLLEGTRGDFEKSSGLHRIHER
jgi:hypothetical protein